MLLRVSGALSGETVNLNVVTDGTTTVASNLPHAETLVAFAEAVVGGDEAALAVARQRVFDELGAAALVDAAAVASNFERMVRVADSTGIPLDDFVYENTTEDREKLDLGRFGSAANTPGF